VHELAHQWFYAMVGNSQARDPWLDEAFATWAESSVDGSASDEGLALPGEVGASTADFGADERRYYTTVYGKGGAALAGAAKAVGDGEFVAAIRCYVNANAWRIADPADLAAQLSGLPAATRVLRDAGALP
jgi:aminopeptidase N